MPWQQEVGRAGEEAALGFLCAQGWRLIGRNLRDRYGELDLVGLENGELVFVEVKARSGVRCGTPEEAWTPEKRRRLWKTAAHFLQQRAPARWRFDLVVVGFRPGAIAVRRYRNVWGRWG
ncbi:MAG TPA: YraN family protein [Firmicutes bacterium]|nr:YraN family protein [Bacillota bacterium]